MVDYSKETLEQIDVLHEFAIKQGISLRIQRTMGTGLPFIGFLFDKHYITYNPKSYTTGKYIEEVYCKKLENDSGVFKVLCSIDSHPNFFIVTVIKNNYELAINQLYNWLLYWQELGEIEVKEYNTGAVGIQAEFIGTTRKAVVLKEKS